VARHAAQSRSLAGSPAAARARLKLTLSPRLPQAPEEFEEQVAQALFDLEATNNGAPLPALANPKPWA
jgi:hypothetical protein